MRALRFLLLIVAIACIAVVVFVRHDYQTTPGGDVIESRMRIGLPPSPWYERVERGGAVTSVFSPASWSSVFGIAAVGSFVGYAWLRRVRSPLAKTQDTGRTNG
jgi:hypothetical protein